MLAMAFVCEMELATEILITLIYLCREAADLSLPKIRKSSKDPKLGNNKWLLNSQSKYIRDQ